MQFELFDWNAIINCGQASIAIENLIFGMMQLNKKVK